MWKLGATTDNAEFIFARYQAAVWLAVLLSCCHPKHSSEAQPVGDAAAKPDAPAAAPMAPLDDGLIPARFAGIAPGLAGAGASEKEGRTHDSRTARLEKLLVLAQGRNDSKATSRIQAAVLLEDRRHQYCAAASRPIPPPDVTPRMCKELDDGTGPYDRSAIARSITHANAERELQRVESELHLGDAPSDVGAPPVARELAPGF